MNVRSRVASSNLASSSGELTQFRICHSGFGTSWPVIAFNCLLTTCLLSVPGLCNTQHVICIMQSRQLMLLDVARWCNGKAFELAISRSRVQILLEATLHNNLRQVVYIHLCASVI